MKKYPKVSIIIPLYVICERFFADLNRFKKLHYPNFEILVVSDKKIKITLPKVKVIITGRKKTGPAQKRDLALTHVRGEICAFIDDDAYPDPHWLKNAVKDFLNPKIAAVGGPGVTPKEDGYWEQLTGLVYESIFCGGFFRHRFMPLKKQFVKDFPAYNLLVRKSVLKKVGGYGNNFYGGEDTFLCLKIINAGGKILYDPKVVVYHHRRPLFVSYLAQIANVGRHRGYFAVKFPETSRLFGYFIPSVFTLFFSLFTFVALIKTSFLTIYFGFLTLILLVGMLSVLRVTNLLNAFLVSVGIILTHIVYGIFFIRGLLTKKLTT